MGCATLKAVPVGDSIALRVTTNVINVGPSANQKTHKKGDTSNQSVSLFEPPAPDLNCILNIPSLSTLVLDGNVPGASEAQGVDFPLFIYRAVSGPKPLSSKERRVLRTQHEEIQG